MKKYGAIISKESSQILNTKISIIGRAGNCHLIIQVKLENI